MSYGSINVLRKSRPPLARRDLRLRPKIIMILMGRGNNFCLRLAGASDSTHIKTFSVGVSTRLPQPDRRGVFIFLILIFMRYTWTSVAILFIWISASVLMVSDRLTDPELFFVYLMAITVILAYIGFRSK